MPKIIVPRSPGTAQERAPAGDTKAKLYGSYKDGRTAGSRFAKDLVRQVRGDRHAEALALVGLNHKQYPEDERYKFQEPEESPAKGETAQTTHEEAETEEGAHDEVQNVQSAEGHDGLRGVKAHEGPPIDEKEDQAGDPTERVA